MGVMVKEELCEKVTEVSDGGCCCFLGGCAEVDLWVCYAMWRKFGRKTLFYDELKCEWNMQCR